MVGCFYTPKRKGQMKKTTIDLQTIAKHWAIEPTAMQGVIASFREVQSGLSLFAQKPLANTYTTTIRDGVAVIPIHGIITPRHDLFTLLMGGTSLELLAKEIQTALDNNDVHAILLDIDSPGGVAVGPSEMADIIRKATQKKPIWAYVGRNCCSAAYWLASATTNIVAQKTALLGSIGVVSSVAVQEQPDADGYKQIEIVSSNNHQILFRKRIDQLKHLIVVFITGFCRQIVFSCIEGFRYGTSVILPTQHQHGVGSHTVNPGFLGASAFKPIIVAPQIQNHFVHAILYPPCPAKAIIRTNMPKHGLVA